MVLRSKGKFAAIEVKADETPHQAIGSLMRLAHSKGILFSALEVYSTFTIGRTRFVRVRSDLDVKPLKQDILDSGRGVVVRSSRTFDTFEVIKADGTTGAYGSSEMHTTPRVTERRSYRGTKDKFWERQFPSN